MSVQDDVLKVAAQVGMLETALTKADAENVSQAAEIVVLKARIAVLEGAPDPDPPPDPPPPPPPPPPSGKTLLGISGSSNMVGAGDRQFSNSGNLEAATRRSKADCPCLDQTWKPAIGTTITRAMAKEAVKNLLDDDLAGIWHESDVDFRSDGNLADLKDKLRMKREFHAHIVSLREAGEIKQVYTENCVSSFSLSTPALLATMSQYHADADFFSIDLDGGKFPKDYGNATLIGNCRKWADDHHNGNLTVSEWGWKDDPAGSRMTVMKSQLANIVTRAKPKMVVFHDNPKFGQVLTAAERVEFAALVKTYNV